MPKTAVAVCKFVGTISLGLLTGLSYTVSTTALPALLALPTAPSASSALARLRDSTTLHRRVLTSLSLFALSSAYVLSPSRVRHPYLLWSTLVAAVASSPAIEYGISALKSTGLSGSRSSQRRPQTARSTGSASSGGDDAVYVTREDHDEETASSSAGGPPTPPEDVNGEEVRSAVERMQTNEMTRGGVAGLAFVMSVVGIWGDAF